MSHLLTDYQLRGMTLALIKGIHQARRVSGFSGMEWWTGMVKWNGMLIRWLVLMGSHFLIMTTSEQRPSLNKDHPNLIAKYLASMVKHVNHLLIKTI